MVRPVVSAIQFELLDAASRGDLTRSDEQYPHWQLARGFAVTSSARLLIGRELIEEGPAGPDSRIPAILTAAGRELLDDFNGRGPSTPKDPTP